MGEVVAFTGRGLRLRTGWRAWVLRRLTGLGLVRAAQVWFDLMITR